MEIITYPIHGGTGQTLQAVIVEQDVKEKRRLETTLAQSEKWQQLVQLAAGVAHESITLWPQLLPTLKCYTDNFTRSRFAGILDLILQAGARASQWCIIYSILLEKAV
jgi:hypothetical protein